MKRPVRVTEAVLRRWRLPKLDETLGKEARGTALVIGGSDEIPGAALLAAIGALRAGAGTLQIATTKQRAQAIAIAVPEARVIGLRTRAGEIASVRELHDDIRAAEAIVIGPGMREPKPANELFAYCAAIHSSATLVVDAAALQALRSRTHRTTRHGEAQNRRAHRSSRMILTPHAGEMAKLLDIDRSKVLADPLAIARTCARQFGAVVVLKGACTYIVAPDGASYENTAGNLGLGTSGSGDTLSGVIAGLCARGADPIQAAVWGVHLHAKAGDVLARKLGPLGYLARELLAEIPPLLAKWSR